MCMLFIYYNPRSVDSEYRLVVVNTRDEFWDRPTDTAHYWGPDSANLSGIDLQGGGTWFAVSTSGRIGSLINVLQPNMNPKAPSRGTLVCDYLNSPLSTQAYLADVKKGADMYNKFNLILIDMDPDLHAGLYILSNWSESEHYAGPTKLDADGVHVFGNCKTALPWTKVTDGKVIFSDIVNRYHDRSERDKLIEAIYSMLFDQTRHLPDPQLFAQGAQLNTDALEALSAIYVSYPPIRYGSRTHTVFLMDSHGACEYIERTLEPVTDVTEASWTTITKAFTIKRRSSQL